jgi:hypothetical protein
MVSANMKNINTELNTLPTDGRQNELLVTPLPATL